MRLPVVFIMMLLVFEAFTMKVNIDSKAPIIILDAEKSFGAYTGEILKNEGFNEFEIIDFNSGINRQKLESADVVILPEMSLTDDQVALISDYVNYGGNLISFRPSKKISHLFGIVDAGATQSEGYIKINPDKQVNTGITRETLQYHGSADLYRVEQGEQLAELYYDGRTGFDAPALVLHISGYGQAMAFTYNLPQSVAFTRQGNPDFAGVEKDGIFGLRGMDLFTDGWVDTSKNTLNQADEQMHLLGHCIEYLTRSKKPLPRFWYFPDTLKCLAVLDNDGEDNYEADFEPQFRDVDSMDAKMTIYLKDLEKVSRNWVNKWTAKGFEIAAHPDDTREADHPTWHRMDSVLLDIKNHFNEKYKLPLRTNVNHWFVWCGIDSLDNQDFVSEAKLEARYGIEMDANYAHYDNGSKQGMHYLGTPGYSHGNYTGTGMVMKYVDVEGAVVDVYQRFNAIYDQEYMENKDSEGFFNAFKGQVDRSLNDEIYSIVSIKCHNNEYFFSKEPLMKMLDYANKNDVPVWTALQLLDFLKMKDQASFSDINWTHNSLSFRLNSSRVSGNGLTFMIPAIYLDKKVTHLTINGVNKPLLIKKIKGFSYAFVTVQSGLIYRIQAFYND